MVRLNGKDMILLNLVGDWEKVVSSFKELSRFTGHNCSVICTTINRLEQNFGKQIVIRADNYEKYCLTSFGRDLYKHSKDFMALLHLHFTKELPDLEDYRILNIRKFDIALMVRKDKSLTLTSRKVHIGPKAVSKVVRDLNRFFERSLFESQRAPIVTTKGNDGLWMLMEEYSKIFNKLKDEPAPPQFEG